MSRRGFAPEERARLWRGWKKGLTLKEIGESLNRRACSVLSVLRRFRRWSARRFLGA